MKRYTLLLASLLLLSACAAPGAHTQPATAESKDWRAHIPLGGEPPPLNAPIPERHQLDNGLTVLLVHRPSLPLIQTTVLFRSGSAQDPIDRPGLAGFVGEMLRAGTPTRSSVELAEAIESLGGGLEIIVDADAIRISTGVLEQHHNVALQILADVVQHPALADTEIERVRRERLAALAGAFDDPGYVASAACRRQIFGQHPYGHTPLGTPEAITAVNAGELRAYVAAHLTPANAAVIIVGSLPPAQALAAVGAHFSAWSGRRDPPPAVPAPGAREASVLLIDKAGAPQSELCLGHLGVRRRHPDYLRLMLANAILGGSFSSRINMNLREDKGYTYGARSQFEMLRAGGAFLVHTAVETNATADSIREVIKEMVTIREADVTRDELRTAKSRYSLSLPGYFETVGNVAAMVGNIYLHDLPLDYYQALPAAVAEIGLGEVRRVAQEQLQPTALGVVVVGDAAQINDGLQALERGPVSREALPVVTAPMQR